MNDFYNYSFGEHQVLQTPNLWKTYQNYNYIVTKENSAVIFDPGEFAPINKTITQNNLKIKAIYLTHHHPDHVGATDEIREKFHCPVYGFYKDRHRLPSLDHTYKENDTLTILDLKAQILFLPGHTLGLCAFYFPQKKWLFSNDLIFSLGCGRVFEGSYEQMYNSLNQVCSLPADTLIFASHEYTKSNLKFALHHFPDDQKLKKLKQLINETAPSQPTVPTTLAFEKQHNPFLRVHENIIRQNLNMENASESEVFKKLRKLKDQF